MYVKNILLHFISKLLLLADWFSQEELLGPACNGRIHPFSSPSLNQSIRRGRLRRRALPTQRWLASQKPQRRVPQWEQLIAHALGPAPAESLRHVASEDQPRRLSDKVPRYERPGNSARNRVRPFMGDRDAKGRLTAGNAPLPSPAP